MDKEDIETILKILSKYIDVKSFNCGACETDLENYTTETDSDDSGSDSDFSDLEEEVFEVNILDNGFRELTL
jgi:hypothetical protein|tara:strand:+ start:903 stop:1118 length:216 start_codon:yes stop_codon:yes gene_type:complete